MSRRRVVTADEARVWRAVVKDAKPLPGRVLPPEPEVKADPVPSLPQPGLSLSRPSAVPSPKTTVPNAPPLSHGHAPGLDRRSAQRLRRGEMEIGARLDLHGHTQDMAHAQLTALIDRAWNAGLRCVLVVTGKGRRGVGVLKAEVPRWLNQSPLREKVIGFSHARPEHGGDGALYVLVRRRRA